MQILDGRELAKTIRAELAEQVNSIRENGGKIPHLAAVLVGEDPASQVYVRNKVRSCERIGFKSTLVRRPAEGKDAKEKVVGRWRTRAGADGKYSLARVLKPKDVERYLARVEIRADGYAKTQGDFPLSDLLKPNAADLHVPNMRLTR